MHYYYQSKKKVLGFTLIELIMVIAVVSIIASISLPNFSEWRNMVAVGQVTGILSTHLREGRIDAVTKNRSIHVIISSASIIYDAPDPNNGFCGDCRNESEQYSSFSKMVTILPNVDVVFFSDGTAIPTMITINAPGATKTITVNVLGRIYVQ